MNITKLGHCALLLEENGKRILTDPGNYTIEAQEKLRDIDIILITHEHADHLHVPSVKKMVETNPSVTVVSNASVAALLAKEGITATVVGDGESTDVSGITIEGFGKDHAEIYESFGQVENTGYLVNGRFYFPGDNFHNPKRAIDVLALPVAGPWLRIKDTIAFAKEVKAKAAFGVHDGMIAATSRGFVYMLLKQIVPETEFVSLDSGESKEF